MQDHIERLSLLGRGTKIAIQLGIDLILIASSIAVATILRMGGSDMALDGRYLIVAVISGAVAIATFVILGLYRILVRFLTGRILFIVSSGLLASAMSFFLVGSIFDLIHMWQIATIYFLSALVFIGSSRFVARSLFRVTSQAAKKPVIIYGAGEAGLQLMNTLFHGRDYAPVAFVDDDPALCGLRVGGIRVHSPEQLPRLIKERNVQIMLLALPNITRARRRELVEGLEELELEIKTIPTFHELVSGKARIAELRSVALEDLLGRDPVGPDATLLGKTTNGHVVMVSGAGGSIGSELCRQILEQGPAKLVLYEISEFGLYQIEDELRSTALRKNLSVDIFPVLGSVQDRLKLETVVQSFGVQTIFHAAAYKHVPLVEENVVEGIRNNVFGTLAIAETAHRLGVENFTLISTDKAVRPANVMGATKRLAELICQALAQEPGCTVFSMVRFGNVLGSSGSVIPKFRRQIEEGGPVTVTHAEINRYFMTIPEASQLVIQAGAMAEGGDVFVLDMGEPVKIIDLAKSMIRLHGLVPYVLGRPEETGSDHGDIEIRVTGLRKGEKLYEELLIGNNPSPTQHQGIMKASEVFIPLARLKEVLTDINEACAAYDVEAVLKSLLELPLDFTPQSAEIRDVVWLSQDLPKPASEKREKGH